MGVYIKGMEMPHSCWECTFQDCGNCTLLNYKPVDAHIIENSTDANCPLLPVPSHGRLIDADKLETDTEYDMYLDDFTSYTKEQIRLAPTIIPAEEVDI